MSVYLDPDFRVNPPANGPYCIRCNKRIKDVSKAIQVTVNWDTWQVIPGGSELIGRDCWKIINLQPDKA